MKKLIVILVLVLTACGPQVVSPAPSQAPAQTQIPTPVAPLSTAPGASGQDLFAQNGITLSAPACDGTFTPAQTEGPFYKANTPLQNILWQSGMPGKKLMVVGYVLGPDCKPISGAWLDFWQANSSGSYDNQGYALRGHQATDAQGRYFLLTVIPGEYPGRTEHIHVKVMPPAGAMLTTQIYFPNAPNNAADGIFDPTLLVKLEDHGDHTVAFYNFVVQQ
jgi:protocatechuate 3,4-dioxygenase beta subunit